MHTSRRLFLGLAASSLAAQTPEKPKPPARQPDDLVRDFVIAGHADPNIPKVKEMLARDPKLATAAWDWGAGDWETALGGAGHIGSREMAHFLLENGARIDAFCAAMLGHRDALAAILTLSPSAAGVRGPHGFSLLYHAAISGQVSLAGLIKPLLPAKAPDYNQALLSAANHGRTEMTAWLLSNGVTDPNQQDFRNRTPLTIATEKGYREIADMLQKFGARAGN
jgi:hypothetical protein